MKKMFDTADDRTGAEDPSATLLKRELRKNARRTRDAIDPAVRAAWSARIGERVLQSPVLEKAEYILCYVSFGSEVMTDGIINHILENTDKKVYIPKIIRQEMEFYRITSLQGLQASAWGIREPEEDPEKRFPRETFAGSPAGNPDDLLVLMPGIAFDRRRGRIGYGGGFYDRYLAVLGGCRTIALAYSAQILERVPVRSFDIRPERIFTETEEIC